MMAIFKCRPPVAWIERRPCCRARGTAAPPSLHPGDEKAGVERVAGAGRVDRPDPRRLDVDVAIGREPDRAGLADLDDGDGAAPPPVGDRRFERRCARVEPGFELVDEDEVQRVDETGQAAIARERLVPAEVPRCRDAALPQPAHDARPLTAIVRVEAQVHMPVRSGGGGSRQTRHHRRQSRVEPGVHAVVGDEGTVAARRERRRQRVRLALPSQVGHPHALLLQPARRRIAQGADDRGLQAEARGRDRGDHGAAADRRHEAIGLDLFSERGQPFEADEDEIVERLTGTDQVHDGPLAPLGSNPGASPNGGRRARADGCEKPSVRLRCCS